ncbi:DUF6431 domain-containing protein [Lactimicrobium sp.]|uniref:DUF6431 domain-containing protein n=1 Tax=Lactimicrobium sp. TaxID=2563780 RepID=UPI003FA57E88
MSNKTVPCPVCSHKLVYRDSVTRYGRDYYDKRSTYLIRRLKCTNPSPCRWHHRELPDFLIPLALFIKTPLFNQVCFSPIPASFAYLRACNIYDNAAS